MGTTPFLRICFRISFVFFLVELFFIVIIKYQGPKVVLNGQDLVLMTTKRFLKHKVN